MNIKNYIKIKLQNWLLSEMIEDIDVVERLLTTEIVIIKNRLITIKESIDEVKFICNLQEKYLFALEELKSKQKPKFNKLKNKINNEKSNKKNSKKDNKEPTKRPVGRPKKSNL